MALHLIAASRVVVSLALAATVAGCAGQNGSPSPTFSGTAASAPATPAGGHASAATPVPTGPSTTSPVATGSPVGAASPVVSGLAAPPSADLRGLAGNAPAPGILGSYVWAGGGSDAPWIVGERAGTVAARGRLEVTVAGLIPDGWTAAWANVANGQASGPRDAQSGTRSAVVTAPSTAGDWSLRVTATFGPGRSATYFWRVTVTP
jgi:hypothetical protein